MSCRPTLLLASAAVACAALAPVPAVAQPRYTIVSLTEPAGALYSYPRAVEHAGRVAGDIVLEPGILNERAAVWDNGGSQATQLPLLVGDNRAIARAIRADGTVVGTSSLIRIEYIGHQKRIYETASAVLWQPTPAGYEIVELNSLVTDPPVPGLDLTFAWDTSESGIIVGWGLVTPPPPNYFPWHAFKLEDGVLTDLGTLGPGVDLISAAWAINTPA